MGYRSSCDYPGGNFASSIDKMLGSAYWIVKKVSDNIDYVKYVAQNMNLVAEAGPNADIATTNAATSTANASAAAASASASAASASASAASATLAGQLTGNQLQTDITALTAILANLPTTEPGTAGKLWLNGGVIMVSMP